MQENILSFYLSLQLAVSVFSPSLSHIIYYFYFFIRIFRLSSLLLMISAYMENGFLVLTYSLDTAIIKHFTPSANVMNVTTLRMPYPPYYTYPWGDFIKYSFAVTLVLGLILPTLQLTKEIVHDREKKLKVRFHIDINFYVAIYICTCTCTFCHLNIHRFKFGHNMYGNQIYYIHILQSIKHLNLGTCVWLIDHIWEKTHCILC